MTLNDWAKAQEEGEFECKNCGWTLPIGSDDVDACPECCDHEDTTSKLYGEVCDDCGVTL